MQKNIRYEKAYGHKEKYTELENDMQLPHSDILDIAHFSRLFDNKASVTN